MGTIWHLKRSEKEKHIWRKKQINDLNILLPRTSSKLAYCSQSRSSLPTTRRSQREGERDRFRSLFSSPRWSIDALLRVKCLTETFAPATNPKCSPPWQKTWPCVSQSFSSGFVCPSSRFSLSRSSSPYPLRRQSGKDGARRPPTRCCRMQNQQKSDNWISNQSTLSVCMIVKSR
jgi:hypothetical protein